MKYKIKMEVCELEKKNFHLFVSLKIGNESARLLVDTGASKTVFDSERVLQFVKEKKIKTNDSKSVGLGVADMETKVVKLKNLTIGKLLLSKLEVAVLPIAHVNETYKQIDLPPIDGVLGSDFFMKYKATINYRNAEIVLNTTKK
ncbi:MAG: retropepsin-like aspartic protease [Bacteroidia bacterium]